jgi:hypothetical protein
VEFVAATSLAINVNIDTVVRSGLYGPIGGLDAVWNTKAATSATNLLHASGPATTVGFSSSGTAWGGPDQWAAPSLGMLQQGLRNFDTSAGNSQQLVIDGLNPERTYDLYLASGNLSAQRHNGVWATTNPTTTPGDHPCGNTADPNGSTWVEGNNYVVFRAVVPDGSGRITVNGRSIAVPAFDCRLPLSGFQLVEAVPGYAGWAAVHAGGQPADLDWNNDGVRNGVAYFMGETGLTTNPGLVDGKVRWKKAVTDAYAVKVSTDLQSWGDAPAGSVTEEVIGSDTYVVFTLPAGGPILLGRLEVTIP